MTTMRMFTIKICGITRACDAVTAAEAGADAIGLNFYAASSRYIAPDRAVAIVDALRPYPHVAKVGVFVNETLDTIRSIVQQCRLDWVQLHGDESAEFAQQLSEVALIRAVRLKPGTMAIEPVALGLGTVRSGRPRAILIDAYAKNMYGGTGELVAWPEIPRLREQLGELPLILAGGLNSRNVAEAIRVAQPIAVDTAGGVEERAGIKDAEKMAAFIASASHALKTASAP